MNELSSAVHVTSIDLPYKIHKWNICLLYHSTLHYSINKMSFCWQLSIRMHK